MNNGNRIINFQNQPHDIWRKFLSTLILFIGILMILWTDKNQGLHDKLVGTLVVLKPNDQNSDMNTKLPTTKKILCRCLKLDLLWKSINILYLKPH